jgi:glycosyltransferase involved in cell wall biosynthesis
MSSPRIYVVIATFLPLVGGAEIQAFAHSRSLRERGYETTIITFRYSRTWPQREVMEGVPVIRVAALLLRSREKLPGLLRKLLYLLAMLVMVWTLWRQRQYYDILHVYQLNFLTLVAAMLCRLAGKPMIISLRTAGSGKTVRSHNKASFDTGSLDTGSLEGTAPSLPSNGRVKFEGDLERLAHLGKPVVRLICSLLESIQAVVVVLSSRMERWLVEQDFTLPDVELIPNGVDLTRFTLPHGDTSIGGREQVVVCVSKLRYEKGIDVLLQAWQLVHQKAPRARLIIVGSGYLQTQLECMAEALGIAASVEFAGLQSDIPAQLYRGSLAVLPSRWEGMPNAVLEAMACGLPCVATRVSGSEDIIQHGVNGLLVESEDYGSIAQALLTLLHDPLLAQKYGQAARERVERHFSLEQIIDKYVELYQRVADGRWQVAEDKPTSKTYHLSS